MKVDNLSLPILSKGLSLAFGTKRHQRLTTLIYHRVLPELDFMRPSEPDVAQFAWQMELLSKFFQPIGLQEARQRLTDRTLPERAVCVTFDDGYADNAELALPILKKYGVPATVFIATRFLNGGRMWNDTVLESIRHMPGDLLDLKEVGLGTYKISSQDERRQSANKLLTDIKHMKISRRQEITDYVSGLSESLPDDLMMTDLQVKKLSKAGIEIGGHTHSHPILSSLNESDALSEIQHGKRHLENLIGESVSSFAYPNGRPSRDFLPIHRNIVADLGFSIAVTTQPGVASNETDVLMIPRFTPWDKKPTKFLARLLLNTRSLVQ
jgi:peptidoglycan/xylan/chitin deacetylase (PgdA/CDA1 family)